MRRTLTLLGFAAAAALVMCFLLGRARLTGLSEQCQALEAEPQAEGNNLNYGQSVDFRGS